MKRKLALVFTLITIAVIGIITLQLYWTFNTYRFNKTKFDADINIAMQQAMDDCKKEYFDSLRIVLVKRLSPPETQITIDTLYKYEKDTINQICKVTFANKITRFSDFTPTKAEINFYHHKINHLATKAEIFTEMAFYVPGLMHRLTLFLGMYDISTSGEELRNYLVSQNNAHAKTVTNKPIIKAGIYQFPPKVREADSVKLVRHFKQELNKMGVRSRFDFIFSDKPTIVKNARLDYSETNEVSYKYHGFTFLKIQGPEFFAKGTFRNPQFGILQNMSLSLILSGLLLLFTLFCFIYIYQVILQQKKLSELKDDFINNMTHELKTPISTIGVAIEGLQNFNALQDKEKTQRYLQTSREQLDKLNDLVSKVLDAAIYSKKGLAVHREPLNINEMINSIISSEQIRSGKKVNFEYYNDGLQSLQLDPLHFKNMLINLIDNAIKYATEPVNVKINCGFSGKEVYFSIKDNGPGIPAAHINHIFEKFYRVPTGNVHTVKGTGLGLSYVKTVVEAHGGTISVKSPVNGGSEFIVSIPLK